MIKLPPDVKEKWLHDLRSGEYKQVRAHLESKDRFGNVLGHCCLGVLSRSLGFEGPLSHCYPLDVEVTPEVFDVLQQKAELPHSLSSSNVNHIGSFLWRANDIWNWNFLQIADWIEENL